MAWWALYAARHPARSRAVPSRDHPNDLSQVALHRIPFLLTLVYEGQCLCSHTTALVMRAVVWYYIARRLDNPARYANTATACITPRAILPPHPLRNLVHRRKIPRTLRSQGVNTLAPFFSLVRSSRPAACINYERAANLAAAPCAAGRSGARQRAVTTRSGKHKLPIFW